MPPRARFLALFFLVAALARTACAAPSNACDDQMGGDSGASLKKVKLANGQPRAGDAWVAPLVAKAVADQQTLNAIFTWPKGSPKRHGCKLRGYTYTKLCVPQGGARGAFRVKVRLTSSCGVMNVKWRISASGVPQLWGRSAH